LPYRSGLNRAALVARQLAWLPNLLYYKWFFGNKSRKAIFAVLFLKSQSIMAHHKSAVKRIRQTAKRRLENRYYAKTTRNEIRDLRAEGNPEEAKKSLVKVVSSIDKLAKRGYIHKNKAANLKSGLVKGLGKKK
jgi:small subunit ribosomal protein S20